MKKESSPYLNGGKVSCLLSLLKSIFHIILLVDWKPENTFVSYVQHNFCHIKGCIYTEQNLTMAPSKYV